MLIPVIACSLVLSSPSDDGWPAWRGPHQDGTAAAPDVFDGDIVLETIWIQDVRQGYSGVSIGSGRVVTMYTDGEHDLLGAFDEKTGDPLWSIELGPMYQGHDGGHDGPASTPIIAGDAVVALTIDGRLLCVDLDDGDERWTVDVRRTLDAPTPFWGFTTTPVVADDLVIVQAGAGSRSLAAYELSNGSRRWARGGGGVEYRSPVLATLAGREQLIAATDQATTGVDPATGETLWTVQGGTKNSTTPVPIQPDCVFVQTHGGGMIIKVPSAGARPEIIMRTGEFRSSYATPVYVDGFIYGFSGSVLTCVDAATGKRCWRSRPPGGMGIIAVGDDLVVLGSKGDVVVVEATSEGYRERARHNVSIAASYQYPAFSNDAIIVRNLGHMAAVRVTNAARVAVALGSPSSAFSEILWELQVAVDEGKAASYLDDLMGSRTFPIVDDDRYVNFVYRGDAGDVGITGTMLASGESDELVRVPGTDFFYRTYEIEPGARWTYEFLVDFDSRIDDPRNPVRRRGRSEVRTSGWSAPDFAAAYEGESGASSDSFNAKGRQIVVWLPPGYESGDGRYPVLVVNGGRDWIRDGGFRDILDHLHESIDPPIVAFVDADRRSSYGNLGGDSTRSYERYIVDEVVPALDRRYRTRADASARAIMGHRGGGVAAVLTALEHPEVFGNCIAISYGRADTVRERFVDKAMEADIDARPVFHLAWNRYDVWRPQSFSCRDQSVALAADLEAHGFEVRGGERIDGSDWTSWRILAGEALVSLYGNE